MTGVCASCKTACTREALYDWLPKVGATAAACVALRADTGDEQECPGSYVDAAGRAKLQQLASRLCQDGVCTAAASPADHGRWRELQGCLGMVIAGAVHVLHRLPQGRQVLLSFRSPPLAAAGSAAAHKGPPCLVHILCE